MIDVDNLDLLTWAAIPFLGNASMIAAIGHPQYRTNTEYREAVEQKIQGMTRNTFQSTVYGNVDREITETAAPESVRALREIDHRASEEVLASIHGTAAVPQRDERGQRAADLKDAEAKLAAEYGPGAIRPATPKVSIDPNAGFGFQRRD